MSLLSPSHMISTWDMQKQMDYAKFQALVIIYYSGHSWNTSIIYSLKLHTGVWITSSHTASPSCKMDQY